MADRIVVMRDGVVEQSGLPLDLYDRPANFFVAGFIGSPSMNLLRGTIRINGKPSFMTDGGVTLPLMSAPRGADGRPCIYGVRPEHLSRRRCEGRSVGDRTDRARRRKFSPRSATRKSSACSASACPSSQAIAWR